MAHELTRARWARLTGSGPATDSVGGDGAGTPWCTLASSPEGASVTRRVEVREEGSVTLLEGEPFPSADIPIRATGEWDAGRSTIDMSSTTSASGASGRVGEPG